MARENNGHGLALLQVVGRRFRSTIVLMALLTAFLMGYVAVNAAAGRVSAADLAALGALAAAYLGLCIRQTQSLRLLSDEATRQVESVALFDDVTGVHNHRYVLHRLQEEISRSSRTDDPFAVMYIDLDHFKLVNDRYGHHVGDAVLREIAQGLRSHVRTSDLVGRLHGDEFLVLLPETTAEGARVMADRFRCPSRTVRHDERDKPRADDVRLSIGIAQFPDDARNVDDLLAAADRAMYRAKLAGGDAVHVALAGEAPPAVVPSTSSN